MRLVYFIAQPAGIRDAQVNLCSLQTLVTKPMLDRAHINPGLIPLCRLRLAESMELDALTNRMRLARYFDLLLFDSIADGALNHSSGVAVSAIHFSFQGNPLQFIEKVRLWRVITVDEYPTRMRRILVALLKIIQE